jgi:hypothetical protein
VRKLLDGHWKVLGISKRNPTGDEVINNEQYVGPALQFFLFSLYIFESFLTPHSACSFQHLTIDVLSPDLAHVLSTVDWIKEVTVMFYAGYGAAPSEEVRLV